jgi:hypothetical protein
VVDPKEVTVTSKGVEPITHAERASNLDFEATGAGATDVIPGWSTPGFNSGGLRGDRLCSLFIARRWQAAKTFTGDRADQKHNTKLASSVATHSNGARAPRAVKFRVIRCRVLYRTPSSRGQHRQGRRGEHAVRVVVRFDL